MASLQFNLATCMSALPPCQHVYLKTAAAASSSQCMQMVKGLLLVHTMHAGTALQASHLIQRAPADVAWPTKLSTLPGR
jgi:hypothetical protein